MTRMFKIVALALVLFAPVALGQGFNQGSHLKPGGQSKVNKALAKGYATQDGSANMENRSVVNIGNKKSGDCTVNVGTTKAGQKAPKEVVVVAKEIINVCK